MTNWPSRGLYGRFPMIPTNGFSPTLATNFNGNQKAVNFPGTGYLTYNINRVMFTQSYAPFTFAIVYAPNSLTTTHFTLRGTTSFGSRIGKINYRQFRSRSALKNVMSIYVLSAGIPVVTIVRLSANRLLSFHRYVNNVVQTYDIMGVRNGFEDYIGTSLVTYLSVGGIGTTRFNGLIATESNDAAFLSR